MAYRFGLGTFFGTGLVLTLAGCTSSKDAGNPSSGGSAGQANADAPTWYQDVAPLVAGHCQGCHKAGGIAPFSMETYAQAKMWSGSFDAMIRSGQMPPFLAASTADCQPRFGFKDDPRLTPAEMDTIKAWADAGSPEGDPNKAAPLPMPPELELKDPEVDVSIAAKTTIDGTQDRFVCYSLTPDFSALAVSGVDPTLLGDRVLIDAAQVRPGNSAIVHHVLVYTDPDGASAALAGPDGSYDCFGGPGITPGGLIMAWAPGGLPINAPEGVAMAIPNKGRLVMQVHYHPSGTPQTDSGTSVQLRAYKAGIPEYVAALTLIGNASGTKPNGMGLQPDPDDVNGKVEFRIPAGATAHTESMLFTLPQGKADYRIWAIASHMHYVGTDMRIGIKRAVPGDEPAEECLLDTPHWNFSWQRGYLYDTPIAMAPSAKGGDVLNLRCTYNNSMTNPAVRDALAQQKLTEPRDVVLGEQTLDEMCLGVFGLAQKVSDLLK